MKSSKSNFYLRSPGSYLARSYLIATVPIDKNLIPKTVLKVEVRNFTTQKSYCLYRLAIRYANARWVRSVYGIGA